MVCSGLMLFHVIEIHALMNINRRSREKHISTGLNNHIIVFGIPLGMCRSVANAGEHGARHPVRDASLTGCRISRVLLCSTERSIPIGMPKSIVTSYLFHVITAWHQHMCCTSAPRALQKM
jgi:hypothetical protein